MKIEDTARSRLLIAVSVLDRCNAEKHNTAETFWARFVELYDERVGNGNGNEIAETMRELCPPVHQAIQGKTSESL